MLAAAALFVLVQIPFGVDVDPIDNNTNMQMIPGHIAGCADLGNGVVLVYSIANLRQKLAAMGVIFVVSIFTQFKKVEPKTNEEVEV